MDKYYVKDLIGDLETEVNNGGFDQYFFNSTGSRAHEAANALGLIGAFQMAELLESAIAKFPSSVVPADRDERQRLLANISPDGDAFERLDAAFFKYPDNLEKLLLEFVGH